MQNLFASGEKCNNCIYTAMPMAVIPVPGIKQQIISLVPPALVRNILLLSGKPVFESQPLYQSNIQHDPTYAQMSKS